MDKITILFVLCFAAFSSGQLIVVIPDPSIEGSSSWTWNQKLIFRLRCDTINVRFRINSVESILEDTHARIESITSRLDRLKDKDASLRELDIKPRMVALNKRLIELDVNNEKSFNESCYASFQSLQAKFSKVERKVRYYAINENKESQKRDCGELLREGHTENGVYTIYVDLEPVEVYCDMQNGGWTVIEKRSSTFSQTDATLFKQNFAEYAIGFGERSGDHWLGLDTMHALTKLGNWVLRVDESHDKEADSFSEYDDFSVGSGSKYMLHLGKHSGTADDALGHFRGMQFLTPDKIRGFHCSKNYGRGWWYRACDEAKLNSLSIFRSIPEGEERLYPSSITMKIRLSETGPQSVAQ